jgi:hypothetical protein
VRQRVYPVPVRLAQTVLAAGMLLLATGIAQADPQYKIQPIVKFGDLVAGVNVKVNGGEFGICGLTDRGYIAFSTYVAELAVGDALIQYADGKFTPIAVPGKEGPLGTWPTDLVGWAPAGMNQLGNLVFTAGAYEDGNFTDIDTFLWDAQSGKVQVVARRGMPAASGLTFTLASGFAPVINNRNEIAFTALTENSAGEQIDRGIFFTPPEGPIVPVAIPGQALPGGRTLTYASNPTLNDAGMIAFWAFLQDDPDDGRNHAYLWERGQITPLVAARADAPGGGKIARILRAWVNDKNRNVLIAARRNNAESGPTSLYLWADGKLSAEVVPGQEMPGGGQFREITLIHYGVSPSNLLGQHAFIATLADGSTAAYRMDADGKLSLILRSGATTELGTITRIGREPFPPGVSLARGGTGVGLNSQGQVALPVQIDGGPFTIVLLTPVAP